MDFSKLSYSEMLQVSSKLKSDAQRMQEILDSVNSQFKKIGEDGTWSGDAANKAKGEFDELKAKFPDFIKAVEDTSTYIAKVVADYQAADAALTN
ncbi:MAG: WXG100 family type VII secretion target [Bacilli bacterium]|nr:WXG100 family type VII secretion target [Bacilli bacterium]